MALFPNFKIFKKKIFSTLKKNTLKFSKNVNNSLKYSRNETGLNKKKIRKKIFWELVLKLTQSLDRNDIDP